MRSIAKKYGIPVTATAVAVVGSVLWPDLTGSIKYVVLATGMLLLGIPHGAVDHIISSKIYDLDYTFYDQLKFYLPYLALMMIMGLIWYFHALSGFMIFFICTIYHFGQSDLIHLRMPLTIKNTLYVSRGLMILGLLIFANPYVSFSIMDSIAGIGAPADQFLNAYSTPLAIFAGIQHLILLILSFSLTGYAIKESVTVIFESIIIMALFLFAEPIIAFTVYFICWHSLNHLRELRTFFTNQNKSWSLTNFYKDSWLFTLISVVGLLALYWLNTAFGSPDQMLALFFILISALTLPHVVVVELMFSTDRETGKV